MLLVKTAAIPWQFVLGSVIHKGEPMSTSNAFQIARLAKIATRGIGTIQRTIPDILDDLSMTFEYFGAVGDKIADDTVALQKAAKWSQLNQKPVFGVATGYKYTGPIDMVDPLTGEVARFIGSGSNNCTLVPVGPNATIRVWGKDFVGAGAGAAFKTGFGGFEIDATSSSGTALDIRRVGLWGAVEDVRMHSGTGKGLYMESVFDHLYRDIEIRGFTGLGFHLYERKDSDEGGFKECSFLTFERVHVLSCNAHNTQMLIDGGDAFTFLQCKPSEGRIGMDFTNGSRGHTIIGTYVDGYTGADNQNTGIRFGYNSFGNNVVGGYMWNIKHGVVFLQGGRSTVTGLGMSYNSPVGGDIYEVVLGPSLQQPVDIGAGLNVLDQSGFGILQAVHSKYTDWVPAFASDSGQTGAFTYTKQIGRIVQVGRRKTYHGIISWTGKPTAGNGFGIVFPEYVKIGPSFQLARCKLEWADMNNSFDYMGWWQDNTAANKLYLYQSPFTDNGASAVDFMEAGSIIFKFEVTEV